jgi:hypothetical protein
MGNAIYGLSLRKRHELPACSIAAPELHCFDVCRTAGDREAISGDGKTPVRGQTPVDVTSVGQRGGAARPRSTEVPMLYRVLGFACAALALAVLLNGVAVTAGEKNSHEGKVVSIKGTQLTMEGKNGKEHSHEVVTNAKITCDGKECKLVDLKAGTRIRVMVDDTNRATRVEAFLKTTPDTPNKQ